MWDSPRCARACVRKDAGMASRINYRILTLFAALAGVVLSQIALAFLVTALIQFRAKDFFIATTTTDFTVLGTCVETLTLDQLKELKYDKGDLDCKNDPESGNRLKLLNTLRTTVHGVYWTYWNGMVDDGTGTGTEVAASAASSPRAEYLRQVMAAQQAHVLGKVDAFYASGVGNAQDTFVNVGLNFTMAFEALELVSMVDVPVSCDDIYGLAYTDISNDHLQVPHYPLPECQGLTTEECTATRSGQFDDTEYELYIKNIRKGRLDNDEQTKDTWPLAEFSVDCPGEAQTMGVDYLPLGQSTEQQALTADMKKYMYAHCVAQFQFASVSTDPWAGTYGMPLPGIEPGPQFYPYPQADGFNSTSSYSQRARMYLGQRFGLSVWAYVPMFLATVFLLGDSIVFFFAEALMPSVIADQVNFATSALNNVRDSLVIASTSKSSRRFRLSIGFVAVLVSIIFYSVFIAAPWGFYYSSLPRPECEKVVLAGTTTEVGAKPDHGVPQMFWKGTKGGWRTDWDATWYDLMTLFLQVLVLLLLPLTTTEMCRNINNSVKTATNGRTTDTGVREAAHRVQNHAAYKFTQRVLVLPLILGIAVVIVGQSVSGARFGMAWAEGVVAQEQNADNTGLLFDEVAISGHVYDQTIATLAATTACGLVFAVAMQRHLINGVGCFSATLFFGWCALVVFFGLPLIFYAMSRSIFSEKKASEDCAVFPRSSKKFENDLCVSRFWTFLVGGGIFVGAVLVMTVLGLFEAFPGLFAKRRTASVPIPSTQEESALMRKTGPATRVSTPFDHGVSEPFLHPGLKPKTRATTANEFLYGSKLKVPPARYR